MTNHAPNEETEKTDIPVEQDSDSAASDSDGSDLAESMKQEQYRQEYLRQIRLRSCPGCGDDEIF